MAEKRCGLGFICASMMQQVELRVEDCPNLKVCGMAQRLEPEAEFELICAGSSGVVPITTTRRAAAVMMLMRRGCPQSARFFGLDEQITALTTELTQLTDEIAQNWMEFKTSDTEKWLTGMRKLQSRIDNASS